MLAIGCFLDTSAVASAATGLIEALLPSASDICAIPGFGIDATDSEGVRLATRALSFGGPNVGSESAIVRLIGGLDIARVCAPGVSNVLGEPLIALILVSPGAFDL